MGTDTIKQFARKIPEGYAPVKRKPDFYNVILKDEGFRPTPYKDSSGNSTVGVGHKILRGEDFSKATKQDLLDLYKSDLEERVTKTKEVIPGFDNFMSGVQESLVSSYYRGSLGGSPKTIEHINAGRYKEASTEFLDNDEYRKAKEYEKRTGKKHGVVKRMERLSEGLSGMAGKENNYAREKPEGFVPVEEANKIKFEKALDDSYQYQYMGLEIPSKYNENIGKIIDVISGGMSLDEIDRLKEAYITRAKEAPGRIGKTGEFIFNQLRRDVETAKRFLSEPFEVIKESLQVDSAPKKLAGEVEEDRQALPEALGGIEDLGTFFFKPQIAKARAIGGFVVPAEDKTRLETAVSDALMDPGIGVYGGRIAEKTVTGEENAFGRITKIIAAGTAGTVLELATFNPKGIFDFLRKQPALYQSAFKAEVLKEIKPDLKKWKTFIKKARPDIPENVINQMTEVEISQMAEHNTLLGSYLKQKINTVKARRLFGKRGSAALPDPDMKKIAETGEYIAKKSAIPATPLMIPDEGVFGKGYRNVINKMKPIEKLSEEARKAGVEVPKGEDPKLLSRQYQGISRVIESTLTHSTHRVGPDGNIVTTGEGLKPILNDFDNSLAVAEPSQELRHKDLQDYLISKRYLEDLSKRAEVKVTQKQIKTSMEDFARIRNKYGDEAEVLDKTAARLYSYQIRNLETLKDSGILSAKQFEDIVKKNPHYVPFKRVMEEQGVEYVPVTKGRFAKTKTPIKAIKGSEKEIEDPIESMIENTINIVDRAHRNKVTRAIAGMEEFFPENIQAVDKYDKGVLQYFEDGKKKFIKVSPDLYESASGMGETALDPFMKILAAPAKWLRTGATITPEFMTRNFIRDQFTGAIQSQIGFRPFIDSTFGLADVLGKTDLYHEWLQSGSGYSGLIDTSRDSLGRAYNELIGNTSLLKNLNIITTLGDLSQVFEEATRVGLFRAAKRKGLSSLEAGFEAREGTLDFGVKGAKTKNITAVKAFLNAQIQAFDKFLRTYKANPVGATMKSIAYITMPSLLLYLHNRKDPEYKELPRWQKDLFWNMKVKDTWVRVPKPFAFGQIFGSLPERFMEYVDENDPSAFEGITKSVYESLSPVATPDVVIPTALSPIIENLTNYSFFREREVVSGYLEKRLPAERYGKYTSETSKALGEAVNISPAKIDNLVRGYTGTSGSYLLEGSDFLLNQIKAEKKPERPKEVADYPVVRGFVGRSPYGYRSESAKKFFDIFKKSEQAKNSYKAAKKNKDKKRQEAIEKKYGVEKKAFSYLNKKKTQMSKLQKRVDETIEKDIPMKQKREEIRKLEKDITRLAIEALDNMKKRKGR